MPEFLEPPAPPYYSPRFGSAGSLGYPMSKCPTHEQLSRLALGTLPVDEIDWVASHVDACPACESTMDRLDAGGDVLLSHLRSGGAGSSQATVAPGTVLGDYV